jgi:hypothetical protein
MRHAQQRPVQFIDDAVTVLDDVLRRMRRHQYKKVPLLHPLTSWQRELTDPPTAP